MSSAGTDFAKLNKNIKKTVYKILEQDKLSREDDWYLIQQVLIEMLPCNSGTAFGQVLQGMKVQGISFEAITRQRRKFLEENPQVSLSSFSVPLSLFLKNREKLILFYRQVQGYVKHLIGFR